MCFPLKSVLSRDKICYGKQKLSEVLNSICKLITSALNVSTDNIVLTPPPNSTDNCCQKASDLDMLAEAIKEKLLFQQSQKRLSFLPFHQVAKVSGKPVSILIYQCS